MIAPSPQAESHERLAASHHAEQADRAEGHGEQDRTTKSGVLGEQAEGDAPVPAQDEIEKWRDRRRLERGLRSGEQRELHRLVGRENGERNEGAERARRHGKRPSARSSRNASASRGLTSGKPGKAVDGSK